MLKIEDVVKSFPGKKNVLDHIDTQFDNKVYGLLGPNGSGKTTLIRCTLGLYPFTGEITFNGKKIKNNTSVCRHIGYLPQGFGLFRELTVYDILEYFALQKGVEHKKIPSEIDGVLERVNLSDAKKRKCGKLSGGMVRRVGLAQAILGSPELIILDEPTAGLDPEERLRFKNMMANISGNMTVIISTHIVDDVEALCDNIAIMNKGKIIINDKTDAITNSAEGKVYITEGEFREGPEQYLQKKYTENGVTYSRVLSKVPCGKQVVPNVEDGYMCLIKKI